MPAERAKQYYALFSLFVFTMLPACLSNNHPHLGGGRGHHAVDRVPRGHLQRISRRSRRLGSTRWSALPAWAFGLFGTLLIYANAADIMPNAHEAAFALPPSCPTPTSSTRCSCASRSRSSSSASAPRRACSPCTPGCPTHSPGSEPGLRAALGRAAQVRHAGDHPLLLPVHHHGGRHLSANAPAHPWARLSILVAALCIFKQDDIKRRFAYSSVDNVGVVALCLGIGGRSVSPPVCCTASSMASPRRSPSAWPVTSSTSTTPAT